MIFYLELLAQRQKWLREFFAKDSAMVVRRKNSILLIGLWALSFCTSSLASGDRFHYSAYLDTSYNHLVRSNHFTSRVYDRFNDLTENGFTLQQAAVDVTYTPVEGYGGRLNGILGRDAFLLAPLGWNPYYGSQVLQFVVLAAYLQYAQRDFLLIGGMFDSEFGFEDYNPIPDTNFSRSILDGFAEPGITVGVRGIYTYLSKLRINAGFNNGWAGLRDRSRGIGVELGVTYHFSPAFDLMLQGLTSEERLITLFTSGPKGRRNMLELVGNYRATDRLALAFSWDYGYQDKALLANLTIDRAVWDGVSAYLNYQWSDRWMSSVRGEVYADLDGYTTGVRQLWRELTLTVDYRPRKAWIIRGETRHDFSNKSDFVNRGVPGASNNQQSFAVEAIYHV